MTINIRIILKNILIFLFTAISGIYSDIAVIINISAFFMNNSGGRTYGYFT